MGSGDTCHGSTVPIPVTACHERPRTHTPVSRQTLTLQLAVVYTLCVAPILKPCDDQNCSFGPKVLQHRISQGILLSPSAWCQILMVQNTGWDAAQGYELQDEMVICYSTLYINIYKGMRCRTEVWYVTILYNGPRQQESSKLTIVVKEDKTQVFRTGMDQSQRCICGSASAAVEWSNVCQPDGPNLITLDAITCFGGSPHGYLSLPAYSGFDFNDCRPGHEPRELLLGE